MLMTIFWRAGPVILEVKLAGLFILYASHRDTAEAAECVWIYIMPWIIPLNVMILCVRGLLPKLWYLFFSDTVWSLKIYFLMLKYSIMLKYVICTLSMTESSVTWMATRMSTEGYKPTDRNWYGNNMIWLLPKPQTHQSISVLAHSILGELSSLDKRYGSGGRAVVPVIGRLVVGSLARVIDMSLDCNAV